MKYNVEILKTLRKVVEINTNSENDAIDKTKRLYFDGKIVLDSEDFDNFVEFTPLEK